MEQKTHAKHTFKTCPLTTPSASGLASATLEPVAQLLGVHVSLLVPQLPKPTTLETSTLAAVFSHYVVPSSPVSQRT
ncbi:hypothetical protein BCR33DRAFT_795732 [Rhizoclosmatium globosum]|uniref:Uncharacterized protein n=1 Tax=Rhizoclosmatium globosum TaxID=329046 RepID=A0A1Y2APY3_9FUNG|nr:hypothetical protein BCR33DRAFT_795732 [Rhizoclosmatium globosum]|eukprot:ORY24639.1 hypothetical protein BCR33DRAFT_795732 [Rhizoclosmatium globosum]